MPAQHCARSARLVTSARSALPRCPLGTALPRSEVVQDEPTYGLTGKKTGRGTGLSHMTCKKRASCSCHAKKQAVRVMQKTSCSTCHEKTARKTVRKTCKLFVSCKKTSCSTCHAKTMQKPCKNHAKTMQKPCNMRVRWRLHRASGAAGRLRRQARQPAEHPLSPGSLLYVLYVLYLTRQATEHPLSPSSLLYVLYVLYGPI